jgi:hypothetical protein
MTASATRNKAPTRALNLLFVVATLAAAFVIPGSAAPTVEASTRVDVTKVCNTVDIVKVHITGYDRNLKVSIEPTGRARVAARFSPAMWDQLWSCVSYPSGLYGWQGDSMYRQLACHATYSAGVPGVTTWTGGPTWDLESWRPSVSWVRVAQVWDHKCNWSY